MHLTESLKVLTVPELSFNMLKRICNLTFLSILSFTRFILRIN